MDLLVNITSVVQIPSSFVSTSALLQSLFVVPKRSFVIQIADQVHVISAGVDIINIPAGLANVVSNTSDVLVRDSHPRTV